MSTKLSTKLSTELSTKFLTKLSTYFIITFRKLGTRVGSQTQGHLSAMTEMSSFLSDITEPYMTISIGHSVSQ